MKDCVVNKTVRTAALATLWWAMISGTSWAADADAVQASRELALTTLEKFVDRHFELPADLALDAALRSDVDALATEHRRRLVSLGKEWVDQLTAPDGIASLPQAIVMPLMARYLNELALWQVDTTGEAYDSLMLNTMRDPGLCRAQDRQGPFAALAIALQRMASGDREKALAAQRTLLARWGHPRTVPERPEPPLADRVASALASLRAVVRPQDEPPLSPMLAWNLLRTEPRTAHRTLQCSLLQWELQRAPTRAASTIEKMALVRYSLLIDPASIMGLESPEIVGSTGYPVVAQRFGVEGTITVEGRYSSKGVGLDKPRVVVRHITVPGIRDVRPIAFEPLLDPASLERAAKVEYTDGAAGEVRRVDFVWRLE